MEAPKYLIAKFTPDLFRKEPKNVGIILFWKGTLVARFIGERENGTMDLRKVPDFVVDKEAYGLWVTYWRKQLVKPALAPVSGGEAIPRESSEFLAALRTHSRGNYFFDEGGQVLDSIREDELSDVLLYLYETIVQEPHHESSAKNAKMFCDEALNATGLRNHSYFKENFKITARRGNSPEEKFTFDYALANGYPKRLYKVISPPRDSTRFQTSIDATLWAFDSIVTTFETLTKNDCAALLLLQEDMKGKDFVEAGLNVLASYANVIDVRKTSELAKEFQAAEATTFE